MPQSVHPARAVAVLLAVLGALAPMVALTWLLSSDDEPFYRTGECTFWAHQKRPELTRGTKGLDASEWEAWARGNGFAVDASPRAGDVAVWRRHVGADAAGHVAYVESVASGGEVYVSEMNLDGCRAVSYARLSPERLSTALFIHRKP